MAINRTIKERKFLKAYIESGGNASEAYLKIYPNSSKKNAYVNGNKYLQKVQPSMSEILDRLGLDDFLLISKLHEGMQANKHVVIDKEIEYVPDWTNRGKFLDMAFKLRGAYPKTLPEKKADDKKPRKVSFLKIYENSNRPDDKIQSKAN